MNGIDGISKKVLPVILVILAFAPLSVAECDSISGVCLQDGAYLQTTGGPIYPGNLFYAGDVLVDNAKLALNPFDNDALTRKDIMEERLAEFEATQDDSALNDYTTKLQGMPDDLEDQANATRELVKNRLQIHERVLERVRDQVPEQARQGIDRAINRSGTAREVIEELPAPAPAPPASAGPGQNGNGAGTVGTNSNSGSYVDLPATAEMGEQVTVDGRVCNDFNSKMEKVVIQIEASKWMGLVKRTDTRVYSLHLYPGQCYEGQWEFTVPRHFMGTFLKGDWDVHIKVTGLPMDKEIIDTHKSIRVV